MNLDPGDDQLVLLWRKFTGQQISILNGIYRNLSLVLRMNMRRAMLLNIMEKHPDQDPVKH